MSKPGIIVIAALSVAAPAHAQDELEVGFAGALRGCEEWILNPSSWIDGIEPFVSAVGLGKTMGLVEEIDEVALPPQQWRIANHYWRINSTMDAAYIFIISDRLPMCHITEGGSRDLQPVVETVLASEEFLSRWEKEQDSSEGDMISTVFANREEPSFPIIVSRAKTSGQRLDRVQVLASAMIDMGD